MSNFDAFLAFGQLVSIDKNMTVVGEYNSTAKGLSKIIEQSRTTGAALICGHGIVAVECLRRGFESRLRFNKLIETYGGEISPYVVVDNLEKRMWHLYRCNTERRSYVEPFSGYINLIGKGGIVPLPGDLLNRFTWLGYAPESPEELPVAPEWMFPTW